MVVRTRTKKTLTKPEQARQVKMLSAMGERLARDNVIMFIAGVTSKVQVHNRATLKEKRLDLVQATAVSATPVPWNIGLYALCRGPNGDEYIKGELWAMPMKVRQRNIADSLNKAHMAFMRESVNRKHLLTLGWIATAGDFLDEETAMKLFTSTGVWGLLDVADVAEDLSVGVTQLLIDKTKAP
jgi:hypothetical protein